MLDKRADNPHHVNEQLSEPMETTEDSSIDQGSEILPF